MSVEVITGVFTALLILIVFVMGGQILSRIELLDATLRAEIRCANLRAHRGQEKLRADIRAAHVQLDTVIRKQVQIEHLLDKDKA